MRRLEIVAVLMMSLWTEVALHSQNIDEILEILGTDAVEEVDQYEVERLEGYLSRPVNLNYSSSSRLEESGLLSRYQIASLMDYRSRHGDILSFEELSAVDGFGCSFVSRLAPFVSLGSNRLPGSIPKTNSDNELSLRGQYRWDSSYSYGCKYKVAIGESLSGGLAVSRSRTNVAAVPDSYSAHVAYHFKRRPGKIVAGDFNARFGQGLALWNGMSFSGLTSSSSFMKKPSFISSSSSFTGNYAFHGVAADISFRKFKVSAMTSFSTEKGKVSILPAMNLAWIMKKGMVSVTHYADFLMEEQRIPDMKTSADFSFCIDGTDLFAETSFDWVSASIAALAGVSSRLGNDMGFAAMLRYYPASYSPLRSAAARSSTKCNNEYALSFASDYSAGGWVKIKGNSDFGSNQRIFSGKSSVDFAYFPDSKSDNPAVRSFQIKAHSEFSWMISDSFRTKVRLSERYRTWGKPFRTDIRTDLSYFSRFFVANLRLNALMSSGAGFLSYLEGGYTGGKLSSYLRAGLFFIDQWDDRIYAYERDAPGTFNVPAYYGRGVWAALTANWRFSEWGRAYFRASTTSYPFMQIKKPGRAELKLQFVFRF